MKKETYKRKELINEIKDFCEHELKNIDRGYSPKEAVTRCYGAVMFIIDAFDAYEELGLWWNDEMHPKFREKGAY